PPAREPRPADPHRQRLPRRLGHRAGARRGRGRGRLPAGERRLARPWPPRALAEGADVVVCPRVSDASLAVGPAAWHFGWKSDAWDALAGAVVAGHVIEGGAQIGRA